MQNISYRIAAISLAWVLAGVFPADVFAESQSFSSGSRQVTLLELFTSQGCSSCPPAERWFNEYISDEDLWERVVPVAFHVDYWDYIGWKDLYAKPEFGERQRDYARAGGVQTVYTPGMFANGRDWRGWVLRLSPRSSDRQPGNLQVTVTDDRLEATFDGQDDSLELHVAILGFGIKHHIERGENRNSTLEHEFVVLAHDIHPASGRRWNVRLPVVNASDVSRFGVAVWVGKPGMPKPVQATGSWLEDLYSQLEPTP